MSPLGDLKSLPKAPPPSTSLWGLGFQHLHFGGTDMEFRTGHNLYGGPTQLAKYTR